MTNTESESALSKALEFIDRLEKAKVWYRLEHVRDSLMIVLAIPGERVEVEFFVDGHIEYERFVSTGVKRDEEMLYDLLKEQEDADKSTSVE